MKGHKTISKKTPEFHSLDFDFLRKKGIEIAQQLSGDIWTDYNEHDPGVTILEQLCFAITDLGYRTNFKIEELLFASSADQPEQVNNAFHPPAKILPTTPISITDFRKLLIDRVPLVHNAWLNPQKDSIQGFEGIYKIQLQLMDEVPESQEQQIKKEVWELLHQHRNLCEDFGEVQILDTESIHITARVDISEDVVGEQVLAQILYDLDDYLSPTIQLHQIEDLMEEGLTIDEIFDGPTPKHGIVRETELPPLKTEIHTSVIKEVINNIEGVISVDDILIRKNGIRAKSDVIELAENKYPVLDEDMISISDHEYPVYLFKGGLPLPINLDQVMQLRDNLIAKERKGYELELDLKTHYPTVSKKLQEIKKYNSFQRFFPQVYGIGEYGLPLYTDRKRRAQAMQLKAYLLIFEQFLSDHLSQLAHVRYLFSIDEGQKETYFSRFPEDIPDLHELLKEEDIIKIKNLLTEWTWGSDTGMDRRNRFLDHLLSRFAEHFSGDYLKRLHSQLEEESRDKLENELITAKSVFLQKYPELSRNRSLAFNYKEDAWETDNISGLKKKICLLLNIKDDQNRLLAATPAIDSLLILDHGQDNKEASSTGHSQHEDSKEPTAVFDLREMLRLGIQKHRYTVQFVESLDEYQAIYRQTPDAKAKILYRSAEEVKCDEAIDRLIGILNQINRSSEGFYFVEHILLRPQRKRHWKIIIGQDKESAVLESVDFGDLEQMQFIADDLLINGTNRENYIIEKGDEGYFFFLKDDNGINVLKSIQQYKEREVGPARDKFIADLINIKNNQPAILDNWVNFENENIPGFDIPSDFYSHRLSLVIPAWSARFSSKSFRNLFEQVARANVPAHLGLEFHWLNFQEMKDFEATFRQWLEASNRKISRQPRLDNLAFNIAQFLINHKFPTEQPLDLTPGYEDLFEEDNLQVFEGIGPKIETLLKHADINTWQDLENIEQESLKEILAEGGPAFRMHDPGTWPIQAMMAYEGRWDDLVNYQKHLNTPPDTEADQLSPSKIEDMAKRLLYPKFELNDLKVISGIGLKVEAILKNAGLNTWTELANSQASKLRDILKSAGSRYDLLKPESWPEQAEMAAAGKWKTLKKYQETLKK